MPLPNLHNKKNIIKLNNSISFFATKEVPFHITALWWTLWPRWEMGETIQLNFIAFSIYIWSPANHSWSGTSSCIVQQNERGNWRAFSLHTPRANNKQTWFPACIKKININLEGKPLWVLLKVWKHLMIFFFAWWLYMSTQPHGLRKPIEDWNERSLKCLVPMRETNILPPYQKICIWGVILSIARQTIFLSLIRPMSMPISNRKCKKIGWDSFFQFVSWVK